VAITRAAKAVPFITLRCEEHRCQVRSSAARSSGVAAASAKVKPGIFSIAHLSAEDDAR
jgi:hypothetical protein